MWSSLCLLEFNIICVSSACYWFVVWLRKFVTWLGRMVYLSPVLSLYFSQFFGFFLPQPRFIMASNYFLWLFLICTLFLCIQTQIKYKKHTKNIKKNDQCISIMEKEIFEKLYLRVHFFFSSLNNITNSRAVFVFVYLHLSLSLSLHTHILSLSPHTQTLSLLTLSIYLSIFLHRVFLRVCLPNGSNSYLLFVFILKVRHVKTNDILSSSHVNSLLPIILWSHLTITFIQMAVTYSAITILNFYVCNHE